MHLVQPLFSVPLVRTNIDVTLSEEEVVTLESLLAEVTHTHSNKASKNTSVLELPAFSRLAKEVNTALKYYMENVAMNAELECYVTQSWVNCNDTDNYHEHHYHSNSFLSGVLYLELPPDSGVIAFSNPFRMPLSVHPSEFTQYNSCGWGVSATEGDLLVFPSSVSHSVSANLSNSRRVSLAFNTFLKGRVGGVESLDRLFL
jgi:uncharacterized protein (TIGR02466 family)